MEDGKMETINLGEKEHLKTSSEPESRPPGSSEDFQITYVMRKILAINILVSLESFKIKILQNSLYLQPPYNNYKAVESLQIIFFFLSRNIALFSQGASSKKLGWRHLRSTGPG